MRYRNVWRVIAYGLFVALSLSRAAVAAPPLGLGAAGQDVPSLAPLLKRVTPAVVNIAVRGHIEAQQNPLLDDPFFRRFFDLPGQPMQREFHAAGSGVIVDAQQGYVLTNNHVVEHADEVTLKLHDGRQLQAELVGTDPEADVAVLQIPAGNLSALPLGNSDTLEVGDFVIAVGNPFGLGQTVTSGMVSALGRTGLGIEGYEDFIQTDASINPGNSGGALVDLRGQLVGINTAIVGPAGGNVGIGFAIPINMAQAIMAQLIVHGEVRRGQLGVSVQDLTPEIAQALGVQASRGAVVSQVTGDSPAAKAGLKAGDVIVQFNDTPVSNAADLRNKVGLAEVGRTVQLDVWRSGEHQRLSALLSPRRHTQLSGEDIDPRLSGAVFGAVEAGSSLFGRIAGVEVLRVKRGSPAWFDGLRQGDVIIEVGRQPIHTPDEFKTAIQAQDSLLLTLRRGNTTLFIALR